MKHVLQLLGSAASAFEIMDGATMAISRVVTARRVLMCLLRLPSGLLLTKLLAYAAYALDAANADADDADADE